jgi:hypothetical protein
MVKDNVKDIIKSKWDRDPKIEILDDPVPMVLTDFILPKPSHPKLKFLPIVIWMFFMLLGMAFIFWSPSLPDGDTDEGIAAWAWTPQTGYADGDFDFDEDGIATNYTQATLEDDYTYLNRSNREWWTLALQSWMYWCFFLMLMPYLLLYMKRKINDSIEEAHKITLITREDHLKLKKFIFGPIGMGFVAGLTVLMAVYDATGFWAGDLTGEGWITDIGGVENMVGISDTGDVTQFWYINQGVAVMWLLLWMFSWIFSAQFLWYAISYLLYISQIINKYTFREEPKIVARLGLTKDFQTSIIKSVVGFIPYLTIKFLYQIFFVPWLSDVIINTVMLVLFVILVLAPIAMIQADLKNEQRDKLNNARDIGLFAMTDVVTRVQEGKDVATDEVLSAMLYHSYLMEDDLKEKEEKKQRDKQTKSVAGPAGSYASKEGANVLRAMPGNPIGI